MDFYDDDDYDNYEEEDEEVLPPPAGGDSPEGNERVHDLKLGMYCIFCKKTKQNKKSF